MNEPCNCKCHKIEEAELEVFCLRCNHEYSNLCDGWEANWDARVDKRRKKS